MSGDRGDTATAAVTAAATAAATATAMTAAADHRRPASSRAIIALAAIGGLVVLAFSVTGLPAVTKMTSYQWRELYVFSALVLAAWLRPLVFRRGGDHSESFCPDEGILVVLGLLVPASAALWSLAGGTVLSQLVKRRPPAKITFNLGQELISAGLALLVLHHYATPGQAPDARAMLGVGLAVGIYFVVNQGLVAAVVSTGEASHRGGLLDGLWGQVVVAVGGGLIGALTAVAVVEFPGALWLAVAVLVVFRMVVATGFNARSDQARVQALFDVAIEANRHLRPAATLESVLQSARDQLRSPDAKLTGVEPGPGEIGAPIDVGATRQWLVVSGRTGNQPYGRADRMLIDSIATIAKGALTNAELYRQVDYEKARLASITLNMGEGVCAVDAKGNLTFVNPAAAAMVQLPRLASYAGDSDGRAPRRAPDFLMGPALAAIRTGSVERDPDARFGGFDGETVPVAYTASAIRHNGSAVGAVVSFHDITERKKAEDTMAHHAFYDSLTGLANRRMLVERLEQALERSKVDRKVHALIFIDVDRFKAINDSLGHGTGDDLLVAIGARLKQAIRGRDLLARFGGDEFVILLEGVTGADEAVSAAHRICAAVEEPVVLSDGYEIVASLSVGIALTEPGRSADDVLRDADVAMYRAKGRGGSYELFDKERMGTRSSERLDLEAALRKGIERDELEVFYQPLVSVDDLRIIGAEALLRWRHPTEGLISPGRFIPVAEESGLILPLGRFVLENACGQVRAIRERCGVTLPINVNLSPRQFQHTGLLDDVATILIRSGIPSNLIVFELTETMVMDDLAGAREIMKKLDRLGVRLAIDDFGTGHSSLGYLKQFPVDKVKVDRIFVQGVGTDPVDAAIVRAVVDLADAMHITAVAEGVETKEQLAGLKLVGCHEAQGYYFAEPLPVDDFEALLEMRFGTGGLSDQVMAGVQAL